MTIPFDETIRAIYYLAGRDQDWMAGINEAPDGRVTVRHRFRYYDPKEPHNDAWSGQDRKNWYEATGEPGNPTLAVALDALQKLMDEMQARGYVPKGGHVYKLVRGTMTHHQMMAEFSNAPFVHKREMSQEEYEAMQREEP